MLNDLSLILLNFEDLVLLSPSEIKRELCKLMISVSQGIDMYKVPVVGKNGKLIETIERSALWSIYTSRGRAPVVPQQVFTRALLGDNGGALGTTPVKPCKPCKPYTC